MAASTASRFRTQEGGEPQTDKVREAVEGVSEGPQTPETGVEEGLDPTTTPSKPGDWSGEVTSQEHRPAGESTKGPTKAATPSSGSSLGQERSGGALERPETSGSTPQLSEPEKPARGIPAEKAPGQPSKGVPRSSAPSEEVSRTTTCSSVKRKATHQEDPHPESGIVHQTPGGGKKQNELVDKDTPRRISASKTADKPKGATEENDQLLPARGTEDVPLQDVAPQERGVEATKAGGLPKELKVQPLLLPQMLRHTELRRRLGQNKAFLPALERALIKA